MMRSPKLLIGALTLVAALLPTIAVAQAGPKLEILAVRSTSDQVSLVVQVRPRTPAPLTKQAVTVVSGGRSRPATVDSVLSNQAMVSVVIDASADAAASLRTGGRSGTASFLLELEPGTGTAVIADRRPPVVAAPTSLEVTGALAATSALTSSGQRATSEALTLALRQMPSQPRTQRVVVLYTSASNAGGESAIELGQRLREANAVLAVVATGPDRRYWTTVAESTGGFAIATQPDQAISAFDALAERLHSRYTVAFSPSPGAARAVLRVQTGRKLLTATTVLSEQTAERTPATTPPTVPQTTPAVPETTPVAVPDTIPVGDGGAALPGWPWWVAAGLLLAITVVGIVRRRRHARSTTGEDQIHSGRQPALPGVRVFDVRDPEGPREITDSLFEPRIEREERARRSAASSEEGPKP